MKKLLLFCILSFFAFLFSANAQFKVLSTGKLAINGGTIYNAARVNVSDTDNSTIYSKLFLSSGWGDAIKSQVNRTDGITFSGWYNSSRTFMVFGNGDVWSATNIYSSDSTLKSNIENVKSPTQVINKLRGVTYFMKNDKKTKKTKHSGLLAQEVKAVLPDLVYEDDKGVKGIAYVELIPYLIEAIKEQQQVIDEQNDRLENIENNCCNNDGSLKSATLGKTDQLNLDGTAKLYQNAPNPFSTQTTIRFEIPETVGNAQLYICNMTGSLLKNIAINQRGKGNVVINGNEFKAGMYLYTLVNDGKIIDTKQMLLTE
ncbi:tail fiber domain-containing protein [uncultured Sunxiuqinia sp.]|uniref:tail fiber domain-containing protein n=1 Tax=uncultured Sunxiuqinia sp. TaxID=1573825 RepID=UPI002AA8A252|nr:tail fiber domain-containing protein [uncultured Sunxiuqinia sp.]